MSIVINEKAINKNGLSIGEILVLLVISNSVDIEKSINTVLKLGYATSAGSDSLRLTNKGVEILNNTIIDSFDYTSDDSSRLENLAEKLRELYPTGRKEGTSYMWKGTTAEIVRKLKTLETKYKFKFSDEQAIKATTAYVQSFNGNYKFMQLLKYFILKAGRDADGNIEVKSEFMSLIQNEGNIEELKNDWMSTMV